MNDRCPMDDDDPRDVTNLHTVLEQWTAAVAGATSLPDAAADLLAQAEEVTAGSLEAAVSLVADAREISEAVQRIAMHALAVSLVADAREISDAVQRIAMHALIQVVEEQAHD